MLSVKATCRLPTLLIGDDIFSVFPLFCMCHAKISIELSLHIEVGFKKRAMDQFIPRPLDVVLRLTDHLAIVKIALANNDLRVLE